MGQIIGIDTYSELQQHVVSIAVDGLSGGTKISSIIAHVLQTASAFGCDDVTRDKRELSDGWNLGTDFIVGDWPTLTRITTEMFLNGIIEGKPLGKNVVEIAQIGAVWGRDVERARRARIEDVRARDAGLIVGA